MVSCLSRNGAEEDDSSLADDPVEMFERGILSDLVLLALPYVATITAISLFPEYQLYYAHKIVQWPCEKVICHTVKYTRDH